MDPSSDAQIYDNIAEFILTGLKAYDPSPGGLMPQLWSSMQNLFSLGDLKDADKDKAQRVITTDKKSPCFSEFSLVFDWTLIVQRAEPLTWMWLAASELFAHPWTGPGIIPPIVEEFERLDQESKIAKAQSKSKKRPPSTPENPKGAKAHDSRPSPAVPMQTELTPPKSPSNSCQQTPPLDATPPCQQVVMSDAVHVIAGTPTGTQEASVPADDVVVAKTHRGRTSAENGAEDHNSAPTYRDTVAALPAPTVPLTTDKRLMRLLAVHWNASPFWHITIFNFASGIWGEITSKVVLLPFADGRFTRQQLWIRNLKGFDKKAKDWAHLKIYLDPNIGNPYILNKPWKTGSKTYKTGMRFGMDTAPPILMQELHSVLSSEPRAGVFPTPIQVSDMVRLGFLPLLPQGLAIGPHCKDLMPFAREANLILAANLDLRKPSCAPFQAPTHYTRDWQAAKDELVLGKQCPQLQSLIEAMRERTWATRVLTAIYRIPIKLPGMLTSAVTENFGKLTFLRFLIAVIATGAQAKKAEDVEPKKPPAKAIEVLSDSESSGDDDDDNGPPTFEWTTIIKKSLVASTPKPVEDKKKSLLMAPKSPEDDDAWIGQLAQMDLTNDRPNPLFVMILTAEEDECYLWWSASAIFLSR
ncbi:unnamed protein product [Cylindrotheca closterium]|uniref:Uncharacterized protein n=1 Tax=Cylindrotheca closterium TaxID=2856 RepID=A0AAD2PWC8_9STRA|nr:unnamed protein product [Cylindrotheca closterium]